MSTSTTGTLCRYKRQFHVISVLFFLTGLSCLNAQETPKHDSLSVKSNEAPAIFFPRYPADIFAPKLYAPVFETAAEKAYNINLNAYRSAMKSISDNLSLSRSPMLSPAETAVLMVMGFFLSNPFGFPSGCVPMMNHSFPFIYAVVPGQGPYANPYSSEFFPKCIESEYDAATGTYKQVMVDWGEYLKKTSGGYDFTVSKMPVPKMPDNPADRFVH